jgi:DNA gyrase/topoisomerase IV subunit B
MTPPTIEEKYKKLTQKEHVLHRSGMYIGEVNKKQEECWVFKETKMVKKIIDYSPAFIKIVDEVISNATDHSIRDPTCNQIKVDFNKESGQISVWNNGEGIPIEIHKEHNIYVPELIFGHLLSGSNYDDNQGRTGAGTNGLGSKCISSYTNIPLFNGNIKLAKDINIGDELIGDDGNPRVVLTRIEGFGKMYNIQQQYGEDYIVNDNHTLTLHMPDHKIIFWNENGFSTLWWDDNEKTIKSKFLKVFNKEIKCPECDIIIASSLKRHYSRIHKDKTMSIQNRKNPTYCDLTNPIVLNKYNEMKTFTSTIINNGTFDITVKDYLKLTKTTQKRLAGLRGSCVNWDEKDVILDPYVLGLWLGDGCKSGYGYACDGINDFQIMDYLEKWGLNNDANFKSVKSNNYLYSISSIDNFRRKGFSPLKKSLNFYNLVNNKHIPKDYLINSREIRLKVLAGIIDTDGNLTRDGTRIVITQGLEHKILFENLVYLARSLGFCCSVNEFISTYSYKGETKHSPCYKINISGNIQDIPTLLPRKKCQNTKKKNTDKTMGFIKITEIPNQNYIGFEIDGNKRFVINDFTVTHNCTNLFSKKFEIETVSKGQKFIQTYHDNMSVIHPPIITKVSKTTKEYTKITFTPDYPRFHMKGLETDTLLLLNKRVYDTIVCTDKRVSVYLNEIKIKGRGLQDYIKLFFTDKVSIIHEEHIDRNLIWEYAIVPYENFEQISFVNGNNTTLGGSHVNCIVSGITSKLKVLIESKKKVKDVKPSYIKEKMFLFLRATVINPTFNSQTKETLTTAFKDFGTYPRISEEFINKIYKSSIVSDIVDLCKFKEQSALSKATDGKRTNKIYIKKLEDALWAGTARGKECTLILTEGDSALTFAKWGRSVVGVEKYGCYPLKGKCISEDTIVPLFNGDIKLARDIKIDDELIGDDGNKRSVLTLFKGNGKMYQIDQDRGDSYKVNDEHILTMCIPEHKKIYWNNYRTSFRVLYWDKISNTMKIKDQCTFIKIKCNECNIDIGNSSLSRHYKRHHKDVIFEKTRTVIDMTDERVINALDKLKNFLLNIDDNNIVDINIKDYLKLPKGSQRKLKGLRVECVNWEEKEVLLDPFVLGLWLGDGCQSGYSYVCDGKNDFQIMDYLTKWGLENDANFRLTGKYIYSISSINNFKYPGYSPLKKILEKYNLTVEKHIPKEYLINSKEIRLKLLAGIIDSDGYITSDGTIEISQSTVHKRLADDIIYLSRSLGFYTHVKLKTTNYTYIGTETKAKAYIIKISGDTSCIPTVLPRKKSKSTDQYNMRNSNGTIKISEINNDNYIGIGIDENNRFVINDFTVTHNCLNIRDATNSQLMNNEEINNLKQIIGLKSGVDYKNVNDLRYGKVMLLTDADFDGLHIQSLIMNIFHFWYPSLLKLNFLNTISTPMVKAIKGKVVKEFFNEQDYHRWQETVNISNYKIKFFKGLGTSKKEDAIDIFKNMSKLKVEYFYKDVNCDKSIELAFEKDKNTKKEKVSDDTSEVSDTIVKCSDKRKEWLSHYDRNSYINNEERNVCFADFINKGLIHFSIYDNSRSIPHLCDGLKPSQRKILYYMLQKNITSDIKVAQLSGYVSAEMSYHHGEVSLQGAIINMAQDFTGSNNINLLTPEGNFGSRFAAKDSASARYIYTRLSELSTCLFDRRDLPLLNYLVDDGKRVEPDFFVPVIPNILVNGCEGIGTGYSTFIPPFNPVEITQNLLNVLDRKEILEMIPYYRGFNGKMEKVSSCDYTSAGIWKKIGTNKIKITELPIGTWISNYKEFLENLLDIPKNVKTATKLTLKKLVLKDVINLTKDEETGICFEIEFTNAKYMDSLIDNGLIENELKLIKKIKTSNMYLFNENMILTKYDTVYDILKDFYKIRLKYYSERRLYMITTLQAELKVLDNKCRFIKMYIDNPSCINNKNKTEIYNTLEKCKFDKIDNEYDYLMNLKLWNLSKEKIETLLATKKKIETDLEYLNNKTPKELWKIDLLDLLKKLKNES